MDARGPPPTYSERAHDTRKTSTPFIYSSVHHPLTLNYIRNVIAKNFHRFAPVKMKIGRDKQGLGSRSGRMLPHPPWTPRVPQAILHERVHGRYPAAHRPEGVR